MNEENFAQLCELYKEYNNTLKPLIATVEALYENFPTPLLNEIRSFNDHIARCFRDNVNIDFIIEHLDKAKNHQKRAIFDCFKFLNVKCNDEVKLFEKQTKRIDLTTINNGDFWIKYRQLKQQAVDFVREAKKKETIDFNESFDLYQNAWITYEELLDFISKNNTAIVWAKFKFLGKITGKSLLFILMTLLFGIISSIIANSCWQQIINFVKSIFN
jgi:hypothetical protein